MQARYYDPVIGRFYSNDPIGYRGVHSFNRYSYAANNPYKYVDPDGKAEVFALDGQFVGIVNPLENNVYVQTANGNQSLNTSITDFHRISSVVYGEGPAAGRTADESTGIANVIANSGERRGQTMLESATSGRFFGDGNEAAQDYLTNWTQGGRTEAPAARSGVISVLMGQPDPTNGSTMFEGTNLINSPLSNFRELYIDTGVAHTPIVIGDTTFFQERNP